MNRLRFLIPATAILLGACATQPAFENTQTHNNTMLILSTQGGDPLVDPVVFNILVRNVTQSFSKDLSVVLKNEGITPVYVLDQTQKYSVAQKLVLYSAMHHVNRAVVLTVTTELVDDGLQLELQAQYVDEKVVVKDGKIQSAQILFALARTYHLNDPRSGASAKEISDMTANFVEALKSAERL